jgi:membrane-associated phospholipid phosphatase
MVRGDEALGFGWLAWAHWVDNHPVFQAICHYSYESMSWQIVLPVVVLALQSRLTELRIYLLAFSLALTTIEIIAMFFPTVGPIAVIDRSSFHLLQFTGATPVDHLWRLRTPGPVSFANDSFGGIVSFPSFHATVAVLIPLTLRADPRLFYPLLVLNAAMLCSTLTEGAHYAVDVMAGSGMAILASICAKHIIAAEDRCRNARQNDAQTDIFNAAAAAEKTA